MTSPTPPPGTYQAKMASNVRTAMTAAGKRAVDLERDLGYTHASALRRYSGKQAWQPPELERIAVWLKVPLKKLTQP
jgi:hypothetical protein